MVRPSKKALGILIVLLFLFIFTLPFSIIPGVILFIYIYWFKSSNFTRVIARFERINGTQLLLACGLTLASIAIYQSANYITHFGFPFSFITYYNFPTTGRANAFWSYFFRSLAVDLFVFTMNVVFYYILLNAIQWLYKKGALWLGGNLHGSR